jgi:hypothetical protein
VVVEFDQRDPVLSSLVRPDVVDDCVVVVGVEVVEAFEVLAAAECPTKTATRLANPPKLAAAATALLRRTTRSRAARSTFAGRGVGSVIVALLGWARMTTTMRSAAERRLKTGCPFPVRDAEPPPSHVVAGAATTGGAERGGSRHPPVVVVVAEAVVGWLRS